MRRRGATVGRVVVVLLAVVLLGLSGTGPAAAHGGDHPDEPPPWERAGEATAGIRCYGNGTSGKRVQLLYVHAPGQGSLRNERAGMLQAARRVDRIFDESADRSNPGSQRHVRWRTDAGCNLTVHDVELPRSIVRTGADEVTPRYHDRMADALIGAGFDRDDRKYLVWVHNPDMRCFARASFYADDDPGPSNDNNTRTGHAVVPHGCLDDADWRGHVEAHEVMHMLGAVLDAAPHGTGEGFWHCTDENDVMCYDDGAGLALQSVCTSPDDEWYFDCNHDDYFRTAADTPYFQSTWNTADSGWLEATLPPPTVAGLSPGVGPIAGGTAVQITGANFPGATQVQFGAQPATSFTVESGTRIVAISPPGAVGTVGVRVVTPGGTSALTDGTRFRYQAGPTVTALSPLSGPAGGGTVVTVTGTGFSGVTRVAFGGTAATSFDVNSPTQLRAVAPAGSPGPVSVRVTTPGGMSAAAPANSFTYRRYRPDLLLRRPDETYLGEDVYNTTGAGQGINTNSPRGRTALFDVRVENDGDTADRFDIQGTGSGFLREVRYRVGDTYVTSAVVAGTYRTPVLAPDASMIIRVSVIVDPAAVVGLARSYPVTATSVGQPSAKDRVVPAVTVVAG